jgi:hypothetical protein
MARSSLSVAHLIGKKVVILTEIGRVGGRLEAAEKSLHGGIGPLALHGRIVVRSWIAICEKTPEQTP